VVERPLLLPDGGMIFDAAQKVRDLGTQYNISLTDDSSYETIGGYVLNRLGFIPRGGESFENEGFRFTVMDMDRRRVSRVKIKPLPVEVSDTAEAAAAGATAVPDSKLAGEHSAAATAAEGSAAEGAKGPTIVTDNHPKPKRGARSGARSRRGK